MKIIEFRQNNTCYMVKDKSCKIDRSDIWENPKGNDDSIMSYYEKYMMKSEENNDEDQTVHVVYLFGQGGIGKSFVCQELKEELTTLCEQEKPYVISLDLQRQKSFEDSLKCMADEIGEQVGNKDMFPRFKMAYYYYKLKKGENYEREERSTKLDNFRDNSTVSLVSGVAGFLLPLGTVTDVIDLANEGYKWILQMRDNIQYKTLASQMEAMEEGELRGRLITYFATDFAEINRDGKKGFVSKHKQKKKFVILLDTVESMRYRVLRNGTDEDYLEWLVGSYGLLRLLPDCFWIMFGREDIPWKNYDEEWEKSFLSREFTKPDKEKVKKYLVKKLGGQTETGIVCHESKEREELAEEIIRQTECYPLAVENCVDVYYRIWNENLRTNKVTDQKSTDNYRPQKEDIKGLFLDQKGKTIISHRFMQYYSRNEQEVLYTLVCLGTWTDEIMENVIWKGMVGNWLIYEEMCATSFVQTDGSDRKYVQGLMLETIMEKCPIILKKKLLDRILVHLQNRNIDESYGMLYESALRIAKFNPCDEDEMTLLGEEFVKVVAYFAQHARIEELLQICEKQSETFCRQPGTDRDLCCAARVGRYFALVFKKRDAEEELRWLSEREGFGTLSYQVWRNLLDVAEDVQAFEQAYKITGLLAERFSDWTDSDLGSYYLLIQKKVELMQQLPQCFAKSDIKAEIEKLCQLADELFCEDKREAGKRKAVLWAEYYYYQGLPDTEEEGEERSRQIRGYVKEYTDCCAEEEISQDVTLCRLELMSMQVLKLRDFLSETKKALEGWRILEQIYGDDTWKQQDAENLALQIFAPNPDALNEDEQEQCRRIFAAYFWDFCKGGNGKSYHIADQLCFFILAWENEDNTFYVSDIILKGILYLKNDRMASGMHGQIRLLTSYYLLEQGADSCLDSGQTGKLLIEKKSGNNLMLLSLLRRETACVWENDKDESQRLCTFLKYIFDNRSIFFGGKASVEEQIQLLGLLDWCGIETERAKWQAEYNGNVRGETFNILETLCAWNWQFDAEIDAKMADLALYLAWLLREQDAELEGMVLQHVKDSLYDSYWDVKTAFWRAVSDDAALYGEEWKAHVDGLPEISLNQSSQQEDELTDDEYEDRILELISEEEYDRAMDLMQRTRRTIVKMSIMLFYRPIVWNRGTEHFIEETERAHQDKKDKCCWVLRAYAYVKDGEGFAAYYWKNRQDIWAEMARVGWGRALFRMLKFVVSIGDKNLTEDYLRQIYNLTEKRGIGIPSYGDLLDYLPQITEWVPFRDVWNRERCIKQIRPSNCDKIYKDLKIYLSKDELLDVFVAAVPIKPEDDGAKLGVFKSEDDSIKLVFFKSPYYEWMKKTFGKAADLRLREKYPKLYRAGEMYEGQIKENYRWQVNKMINEIRDCVQKQ